VTQFVFWKMKTDPLFQAVEARCRCAAGFWIWVAATASWRIGSRSSRRNAPCQGWILTRTKSAWRRRPPASTGRGVRAARYFGMAGVFRLRLCVAVRRAALLPRELKAEVLRKVFQALRPGGCLIVRDACAEETSRHGVVPGRKNGRCALARTKPVTVCILKTKKPTSYCCARRVLTGLKSERTPGLARTRC